MHFFKGTVEELKTTRVNDVTHSLYTGKLGPVPGNMISMTDATEDYYGTSGRGSSIAKTHIRFVANLGYIKITKKGRNEYVSWTDKGLEAARAQIKE